MRVFFCLITATAALTLKEKVEKVLGDGSSPNKQFGLPVLDPLAIPALVIGAGSGPVALQQNYKNVKVAGYSKMRCSGASFDNKTLALDCTSPQVVMTVDYDINGRILLLPVYGNGQARITLDKLNFKLKLELGESGKVVNQTLEMTPELIVFRYDNLFNGDETLSDNIHKVLNENWKEVYGDVKASYEDAFGQVFASLLNTVLGKKSVTELFGGE